MDASQEKSCEPGLINCDVRLLGTGAAVPTKVNGYNVLVARSGVGVLSLTVVDVVGLYAGAVYGFEASTPANLAGFTVVLTPTSNNVIGVQIYNGSNTLTDLAAAQWLNLTLKFKSVTP